MIRQGRVGTPHVEDNVSMSRTALLRAAQSLAALLLIVVPSEMSLAVSFGFVPDACPGGVRS